MLKKLQRLSASKSWLKLDAAVKIAEDLHNKKVIRRFHIVVTTDEVHGNALQSCSLLMLLCDHDVIGFVCYCILSILSYL